MDPLSPIDSVARVIQLAVAPVFLLAGIAGMLSVLSMRLGRITDRARTVERRIPGAVRDEQKDLLQTETNLLWRRIRLINWAIRFCVSGALMVCLVIVGLFVADYVRLDLSLAIAVLFVSTMLLIVTGLVFFLSEVGIATHRMRQGMEIVLDDAGADKPSGT
jgi:hypothetical protein